MFAKAAKSRDASLSTDSTTPNCTYWIRPDDGREFLTDPEGTIVNLARLTAFAEHGSDVYDRQVHHQLPVLKIDAPAFLTPLSESEHGQLHGGDPEPVEVDGIPRLCRDG